MKPKVWITVVIVCLSLPFIAVLYYYYGPKVVITIRQEVVPVEPILDAFYSHKSPEEFLKLIRENPSIVNESFMENSWQNTPLKYAAFYQKKELVKLFILENADVNDALNYFKQSDSQQCKEAYTLIQNTIKDIEKEKNISKLEEMRAEPELKK